MPCVVRGSSKPTKGIDMKFKGLPVLLMSVVLLLGIANAQKPIATPQPKKQDLQTLEGLLRVHPKFHYRYYIDGFGDGQQCALFKADKRLRQLKPGSVIRVQGRLRSDFFGPRDNSGAMISSWIIYMEVQQVKLLREPIEPTKLPVPKLPVPRLRSK